MTDRPYSRLGILLLAFMLLALAVGAGPARAAVVEADDVTRSVDSAEGVREVKGLEESAAQPGIAPIQSGTTSGASGSGSYGMPASGGGEESGGFQSSGGVAPGEEAAQESSGRGGAGPIILALGILAVLGAGGAFAWTKMKER